MGANHIRNLVWEKLTQKLIDFLRFEVGEELVVDFVFTNIYDYDVVRFTHSAPTSWDDVVSVRSLLS